jgi:hypothetical protein
MNKVLPSRGLPTGAAVFLIEQWAEKSFDAVPTFGSAKRASELVLRGMMRLHEALPTKSGK